MHVGTLAIDIKNALLEKELNKQIFNRESYSKINITFMQLI